MRTKLRSYQARSKRWIERRNFVQSEISEQIKHGLALQQEGAAQAAINYFIVLANRFPEHAEVLFETGGVFDSNGYESEAISSYTKAMEIGLRDDLLVQAMV